MLRDLIAVENWAQDTTTTFYTDSAVKISNMKRRIEDFTKGDILTYGANGFLRDGIHPTGDFVKKIWIRLARLGRLGIEEQEIAFQARDDTLRQAAQQRENVRRSRQLAGMVQPRETSRPRSNSQARTQVSQNVYMGASNFEGRATTQVLQSRTITSPSTFLQGSSLSDRNPPGFINNQRTLPRTQD